jgi:hypothetical protein
MQDLALELTTALSVDGQFLSLTQMEKMFQSLAWNQQSQDPFLDDLPEEVWTLMGEILEELMEEKASSLVH